ncbi:MAG TPA: hypothetical protein VHI77_07500 [Solirubrobacterales bacterium]|nr:hypothetical protein [Solirubrobacterales bacterium]
MPIRRLIITLALGCGLLSAAPGSASAAQVFGSPFTHEPANSGECAALGQPCTLVSYIHPLAGSGDPYAGGAPSAGVVTKVRLRARVDEHPTQVTFLLANLTADSPTTANASIAAVGPTVTLDPTEAVEAATGETPIRDFAVRMPVQKGQQLAIQGTDVQATYNQGGDKFSFVFAPALVPGLVPAPAPFSRLAAGPAIETTGELLIQGTIEPDADGDGFGDETQDQCPTQRTTQGPCDTAAPLVSGLRVRHGRIRYTLSEPATVALRLARKRGHGFRPLGKGPFAGPGNAGANVRPLPSYARRLAKGAYRLSLTVADALGNQGSYTTGFRVEAPPRHKR